MDDVGCGRHDKGMLTARGGGVGSDDQRESLAEVVRCPACALIGLACGSMVDRSTPRTAAGREGQDSQSRPGRVEPVLPGPALDEM